MPSTGLGLRLRAAIPSSAAFGPSGIAALVCDYLIGLPPTPVVDIPYLWLRPTFSIRHDPPTNDQRVSQRGGSEYRARNADSLAEHLTWAGESIELDTYLSADPRSLAEYTVDLHGNPRDRAPRITLDLLDHTKIDASAQRRLLGIELGTRILITDAPSTWPPGLERLTVEGIRHEVTGAQHLLIFNTSPMIGASPGEVGPWMQLDSTPLGTLPIPF